MIESFHDAETEEHDVAVIGGGGAGSMAFLRAILNGDRAAILLGDADTSRRGRATWVKSVDNIPGLFDLANPITTAAKQTFDWIESREDLAPLATKIRGRVTALEREGEGFRVRYDLKGEPGALLARFVILATGVMDVQPEIGGSIQPVFPFANRGDVLYCMRCDGHRVIGHRTAVIGARDSAVGIGAVLMERYDLEPTPILTNGKTPELSDRSRELAGAYGIPIHEAAIEEVLGDASEGGLTGFALADGTRVDVTRAFVSLGVIAYNELLVGLGGEIDERGRAAVREACETSVDGLFCVGDLVSGRKMQVYTAWDEAVDAADEINRRLRTARRQEALAAYRESRTG